VEPNTQAARQALEATERLLKAAKQRVQQIERDCDHNWDVKDKAVYYPAYTIPGDAPGTMGVDWRGPCDVPSKTVPQWERTCSKCGKVEHTKRTKKQNVQATIEGGLTTMASATVPDWSLPMAGPGDEPPKSR
jgi:hypothetical protein